MASKKYEIDMCTGAILPKVMRFTMPLMLSTTLQMLFSTVDMAVVGRFVGSNALAAVGATNPVVNLLVGLFTGLSGGTNVVVARAMGSHHEEEVDGAVHTSVLLGFLCGCALAVIGWIISPILLTAMDTPAEVFDQALLYIRIYFLGMPALLLYNFGAAVLRAVGDTKRPLYFLTFSGIINVVMNLIFVIVFHMDVEGVAIATLISQTASTVLVLRCLITTDSVYRLDLRRLRIQRDKLVQIARIGIPAGIQSSLFSISNLLIQSSLNSYGATVIAANTAGQNIDSLICVNFANSLSQASLSFVSQNAGAKKYRRVDRVTLICTVLAVAGTTALGAFAYIFGEQLLGIYTTEAEVIAVGIRRLGIMAVTRFLNGLMNVFSGALRGLGYGSLPAMVSLAGVCGLRILWLYTAYAAWPSLEMLWGTYPLTWGVTSVALGICYLVIRRKFPKTEAEETA